MKTHYSCAELAAFKLAGYPTAKKNWIALVEREGWERQQRSGRGGGFEYTPSPAVLKLIREQERIRDAVTNPTAAQRVMAHCCEAIAKLNEADAAAAKAREERATEQLRMLAGGLSAHEALSLNGHCEIAQGWKVWFAKQQPLKKTNSWAPFANAYNLAEVPVSKAVRDAFPSISPRSIQRWVGWYEAGNFEALVDRRNGSDKKGKNIFTATPLLAAYATKMMLERPGITTEQLCTLLGTASRDAVTGEALFTAPSYHQTMRFQNAWKEENHDLYLRATNPDAWKNSVMLAFGSYSADVTALNQRWEMDATPADWLLIDEDGKKRRYTVVALCRALSLIPYNEKPKGTIAELADMVGAQLATSRRVLIIDEFDFAVDKGLVMSVFSIYEKSKASILLIGEEAMPANLARWEKFSGRVLDTLYAEAVGFKDAQTLARHK